MTDGALSSSRLEVIQEIQRALNIEIEAIQGLSSKLDDKVERVL